MATIHKCDKCKKIIKNGRKVEVRLTDMPRIFGEEMFYSRELCEKCAKLSTKVINKIFRE